MTFKAALTLRILIFLIRPSYGVDFNTYNSTFSLSVTKMDGKAYVCSSVAVDPQTLVTAAHCLDEARDIQITDGKISRMAYHWQYHPDYDKQESKYHADVGLISLSQNLPYFLNYPRTANPQKSFPLFRIGFGAREGQNLRTLISGIKVTEMRRYTLVLKDSLGVPGDSGGPLFQFINGKLTLVAIHSTVEGGQSYAPILNNFLY